MVTVPQTCTFFWCPAGGWCRFHRSLWGIRLNAYLLRLQWERVQSVSSSCFFHTQFHFTTKTLWLLPHLQGLSWRINSSTNINKSSPHYQLVEVFLPSCNQTQLMCSVTYTTNTGKILCSIHRLPIFHKNMRSTAGYSLQVKQKAAFLKIRFKKS